MSKNNAGLLTFRVKVHNFNADMSLEKLGQILHDAIDAKTLETIQEHTKDQQWIYEIEAYAKLDGDNKHSSIGQNLKNIENADFLTFETAAAAYQIGLPNGRILRLLKEEDGLPIVEIIAKTLLPLDTTQRAIDNLIEKGEIQGLISDEGIPKYYIKER